MNTDRRVLERIDALVQLGERVLSTRRSLGHNASGDDRVESQLAHQWITSSQSLLARVFGADSEHYKNFSAQVAKFATYSPVYRAQGVLKAAKDDFEHGHLFEVRRLIEAEVFDDFLEQAAQLFSAGYHAPAAVVAGCVLEDGLRKLCVRANIALGAKPKLDTMNAELAKAGVLSKLEQKRVTALADLRNSAAHGEWDKFSGDDVGEMIEGVRRFMETHFA